MAWRRCAATSRLTFSNGKALCNPACSFCAPHKHGTCLRPLRPEEADLFTPAGVAGTLAQVGEAVAVQTGILALYGREAQKCAVQSRRLASGLLVLALPWV